MAGEMHEKLTERFVKAIHKSFDPCPLIGPKWFRSYPTGKPADFRFAPRNLAKAMGMKVPMVARIVVRHLDLKGIDADVEILTDGTIDVTLGEKHKPAPRDEGGEGQE